MRIYSKDKDYYDGQLIQISSLDRFVRHEDHRKKVTISELPDGLIDLALDNRLQYLFFCGYVYPFLASDKTEKLSTPHPTKYSYDGKPVYEQLASTPPFLWSYDEIREYLEKTDQLSFCFREVLAESFAINDTKKLHNVQLASGVCYFVFKPVYNYKYRAKINASDIAGDLMYYPSLQSIQAYKTIDAFSAAQQIDYWLGNIFVSDDCLSTQTNDNKITAHGHDLKISFRSESGAKRRKNAKNRC